MGKHFVTKDPEHNNIIPVSGRRLAALLFPILLKKGS